MNKEIKTLKREQTNLLTFILVVFAITLINSALIMYFVMDFLPKTPTRTCETIEKIEEIVVSPREKVTIPQKGYDKPDYEIICQKGLSVYEYIGLVASYGEESGICFLTTQEEVCTIE